MISSKNHSSASHLSSQKGNAILYAMILSLISAILVASIAQYFGTFSKTVFKNNDMGALRAVLNSTMDYTINGVRNRWCFAATWSPNPVCKLTDANNIERLLISDEALRSIQGGMPAANYGNDISKVRTKSIVGTVKWADITPDHPLYYAVKGLKDIGQDFVFNFKIIRTDNGVQKGREVALQIEVELQLGAGALIKSSNNTLTIITSMLVFPREINTNALLIANNLFLDRKDPGLGGAANGNVYISPVASNDIPGLLFESPVFVNGNVYIPAPGVPGYTPVTFGDKVIIGGGTVLEGTGSSATFSKPSSAGGSEDRFYTKTESFGGFLRGILLDPGADAGLNVLGMVAPGTPPDLSSTDMCILRNSAKVDLSITRDAQLFLRLNGIDESSVVNGTYNLVAHVGSLDNFYRQSKSGDGQFLSKLPNEIVPQVVFNDSPDNKRPIMRATVALNGYTLNAGAYVSADLSPNSVLTIPMNPSDASAAIKLTTTPYLVGGVEQNNAANIKVELLNQDKWAMAAYPVKLPNSTMTSSAEPSIDVNIEAFDVAYTTSKKGSNLSINSGRIKGSSERPLTAEECPPGSPPTVINGVNYPPCYNQYAWNSVIGKYKNNGFSFRTQPKGTTKQYKLVQAAAAGKYYTCNRLDATCPAPLDANEKLEDKDWVNFDRQCFTPPAGTDMFPSFGPADWATTSFTPQARHSWGFTEPGLSGGTPGFNPGTLNIDGDSARLDASTKPIFWVNAIHNNCVIKSTANFVAGFLVCDNLLIESRTEPLRIIGTFIVSKMEIHPDAFKAGIRWSNIYYPTAVSELRQAGILSTSTAGESCDVSTDPMWHPYPSVKRAQFLFKCNSISLRNKADPFKWTMVDPDCGLVADKQQCKYRVMRYDIVELKRQEIL